MRVVLLDWRTRKKGRDCFAVVGVRRRVRAVRRGPRMCIAVVVLWYLVVGGDVVIFACL